MMSYQNNEVMLVYSMLEAYWLENGKLKGKIKKLVDDKSYTDEDLSSMLEKEDDNYVFMVLNGFSSLSLDNRKIVVDMFKDNQDEYYSAVEQFDM